MGREIALGALLIVAFGCHESPPSQTAETVGRSVATNKGTAKARTRGLTKAGQNAANHVGAALKR